MALKERVLPSIYHEKQEPDSSLCAQHCLNNLVQEQIWTAADLADLARQLDQREQQARRGGGAASSSGSTIGQNTRNRRQGDPDPLQGSSLLWDDDELGTNSPNYNDDDDDDEPPTLESRMRRANPLLNTSRSRNMDDSGFFSVQVMDEALKSFNLQLVRWRSQDLRSIQAAPEKMEAFVFNLSSHWFVIRKFGKSKHFWFDLNSFHQQARHVSPLYLGLQIDQAEHEGYSVFVVLPTSESSGEASNSITTIFSLPHSRADDTVAELADEARALAGRERGSGAEHLSSTDIDEENLFTSTGTGPDFVSTAYAGFAGLGDEDEELNKAIAASLSDYKPNEGSSPSQTNHDYQAVAAGSARGHAEEEMDPELAAAIAASLETPSTSAPASAAAQPNASIPPNSRQSVKPEAKRVSVMDTSDLGPPSPELVEDEDGEDTEMTTEAEEDEDDDDEVEDKPPTAEELRLKRLARFGGA